MTTQLPEQDVSGQVCEIVARVCRLPPSRVGEDDRFRDDLGIDSLAKLEVVVQVERAFGRRFDDDQAATIDSVRDIVRELRVDGAR